MKIIKVDNFARETYDDVLVCENVNTFYGTFITNALNEKFSGENSEAFFKLVKEDYTLYKCEW